MNWKPGSHEPGFFCGLDRGGGSGGDDVEEFLGDVDDLVDGAAV